MKFLTIFAASVFAVSMAFSGAVAADMAGQGSAQGSSGYGQSVQDPASQGSSGMGSQSGQDISGQASAGQIRQVQQRLTTMGYSPGNVNGEMDAQTMEAIRNFQQAQGLQPSGQLDVQTLQALGVSGQEGDVQKYYGVSPEFDSQEQPQQLPQEQGIRQPGQQMDQQQLDRQYEQQQTPPSGTMSR